MANLETRGKNYTSDRDLCVKDSCKSTLKQSLFYCIHWIVYLGSVRALPTPLCSEFFSQAEKTK